MGLHFSVVPGEIRGTDAYIEASDPHEYAFRIQPKLYSDIRIRFKYVFEYAKLFSVLHDEVFKMKAFYSSLAPVMIVNTCEASVYC